MIHYYNAKYKDVVLRPLLRDDIETLRQWRNDAKLTRYLRNIGYITSEMQEKWFQSYETNDKEIAFAIVEINDLNRIVGSISLYDINDGIAEVGRIQVGDNEAHGKSIGKKALVMAMWIAFNELKLNKIISEVHRENIAAHKNHMSIGFEIIGKKVFHAGGFEDKMEMTKERLVEYNQFVEEIKLYK